MIGIIDYGAGNLFSVQNGLRALNLPSCLVGNSEQLEQVSHLILPGVGSFGVAMKSLTERSLIEPLQEWWRCGRPILGICLGLQLMTQSSEESPGIPGLGWFDCHTVALSRGKIPHMGWTTLKNVSDEAVKNLGVSNGQSGYFVHSYAVISNKAAASCEHEEAFAAVLGQDKCWGVQFHPEKSGRLGLNIFQTWRETCQ